MDLYPNTPKMNHLLLQLFPQHPLLQKKEEHAQSISKLRNRSRSSASVARSDLKNGQATTTTSVQEKEYKVEPIRNLGKPKAKSSSLRRSKTTLDSKRQRRQKRDSSKNSQVQVRPTTHPKPVLIVSSRCWTPPSSNRPRDSHFEQEPAEQKLNPKDSTAPKRPSKPKSQSTYKANQQDFLNRNFEVANWNYLRPPAYLNRPTAVSSTNHRFGPTALEKLKFAESKLAMSLSGSGPRRTLDKALQHGIPAKYSNAASNSDDLESGPSSPQSTARALSPVQSASRWKKANVYIGSYSDSDENADT